MGSIHGKPIFIYHKLVLSLRFEFTLKITPLSNACLKKASFIALIAPRKQIIPPKWCPIKGQNQQGHLGHSPPPAVNQQHATEDTGFSSPQGSSRQRPTDVIIRRPYPLDACGHEGADEGTASPVEQASLDHKRAAHETEARNSSMTSSKHRSLPSREPRSKHSQKTSLELERHKPMAPSQIRGGPDKRPSPLRLL